MEFGEMERPIFKPLDLLRPERPQRDLATKERWSSMLAKKVAKSDRTGRPLSVIFLDVNHFKDVNDIHGHDIGDILSENMEVIVGLVNDSLRTKNKKLGFKSRNLRKGPSALDLISVHPTRAPRGKTGFSKLDSLAARVGGDEYAILCEMDEAGAQVVANRLRSAFADFLARPDAQPLSEIGIGVSIGTSTLKPGMDARSLLAEADQAMFQDKLSQLKPLTIAQEEWLNGILEDLKKYDLRLRDLGKYILILNEKRARASATVPSSE